MDFLFDFIINNLNPNPPGKGGAKQPPGIFLLYNSLVTHLNIMKFGSFF